MFQIIDNWLDKELQDELESMFLNSCFPWYLCETKISTLYNEQNVKNLKNEQDKNLFEYTQFVHTFVSEGAWSSYEGFKPPINSTIESIARVMDVGALRCLRVKANFQTKVTTDKLYNTPHLDMRQPGVVGIYYVNSNDGCTYFFEDNKKSWTVKHKVESKKGRLILFDSDTWHAGSHPKESPYRVVINFNFVM